MCGRTSACYRLVSKQGYFKMKLLRLVLFFILICTTYWAVSIVVMLGQGDVTLGASNFVIQCALPYVVGCQISQQLFSSSAVYRFKTRKQMIDIHIVFDCLFAFFLVGLLFIVLYLCRLLSFKNGVDNDSMSSLLSQFIGFFLGMVQLSLLGKTIIYSNIKMLNFGGYLAAFLLCDIELLAIERMSRYYLPFDLNIFFAWAVNRGNIWGYTICLGWIILLVYLLHRIVERKDFFK